MRLVVLVIIGLFASRGVAAHEPAPPPWQPPITDGFQQGDYPGKSYRYVEKGRRGFATERRSSRQRGSSSPRRPPPPVPDWCYYSDEPQPGWTCD